MVTDTLILSRVADASIYVCRADYTHKTDYQLINELQEHHRLPNLCTVVNGIDMRGDISMVHVKSFKGVFLWFINS